MMAMSRGFGAVCFQESSPSANSSNHTSLSCGADAGQVLSFPGGTLLHGGEPVTRGRRYILAVFAYLAGSKPVIRTQLANHSGDGIPTKVENGDNTRKRPTQEVCLGFGGVQWKAHKPNEAEEANSAGVSGGLFNFSF